MRDDDDKKVLLITSRSDEELGRIEPHDSGCSRANAKAGAGGHEMGKCKAM